ncbi:Clp protease N-terminal domain-containing protein [Hymenobacter sp. APR13]|uniref:Clp protease N-terminal domain-containing protein n=1 Tax=Hymenobacter sp. APR13 TaxID=1356852 RepID=UPI0004E05F71|nr:Clp protease N-terminal domain-containing protein [Hymenobacter sp. APR13]AII52403.1 hypothetical protein N008_10495 [Hymenobacter sp. APR13]
MFSWWKSRRELPFSDSLQHVIRRSREEALRLQNDYVGPEHLLLAMLAEPESRAAQLLDTLLVSSVLFGQRLTDAVTGHRLEPDQPLPTGSIALTVEAEQALHSSQRVARQLRAPALEALHLLLPLLAQPTGRGALLSADFGLTFEVVLARMPEPDKPGR